MQRATVKNATKFMFQTGCVSLTDETSYDTFLAKYAYDFSQYSTDELTSFAWVIFKAVTGWDSSANVSLRSIQSDLIDIMMKLSSYTIHTIKTIDDGTDVTEFPYDNMIGDSAYLGLGNALKGDFEFSELSQKWDERLYAGNNKLDILPHSEKISVTQNSKIKARFRDTTNFRMVNSSSDPRNVLKIPNNDYLSVIWTDNPTDTFLLPGTYYRELAPSEPSRSFPYFIGTPFTFFTSFAIHFCCTCPEASIID